MTPEMKLREAVRAGAAPVPEDFLWNTEQMIDRLPGKERPVMKRKLSFALVLALLLCLLAVGAVAAVLLSSQELVEREVLPMALENDAEHINDTFTNAELARIVALAEENDIKLSDSILRALEKGEGYWEEEVIMSLAKSQFGPVPAQWTIEEQYWFEETLVTIGFQDSNYCLIPSADDLTYEAAYEMAVQYLAGEGWVPDPAILEDRTKYSLWRTYQCVPAEAGGNEVPEWNFIFDPKDIDLPTLSVLMNQEGGLEGIGRMPGVEEQLAAGTLRANEAQDMFTTVHGSIPGWPPEVFVAYVDALRRSDLTDISSGMKAYLSTQYIIPPENALTSEQAIEIAVRLIGGNEVRVGGAYCFEVDGRALWKVTIASDSSRVSDMVEMDAVTGEILEVYKTEPQGGAVQFYVPHSVWQAVPTPNPEGNG